jgi:hypothetical protein
VPIKQNGTKLVFGFAQHDTISENISEILRFFLWIMGIGMTTSEVQTYISEINLPSKGSRVDAAWKFFNLLYRDAFFISISQIIQRRIIERMVNYSN